MEEKIQEMYKVVEDFIKEPEMGKSEVNTAFDKFEEIVFPQGTKKYTMPLRSMLMRIVL